MGAGGLVAYVLAMAFTLVYTGEHYVADIVIGWLYAAAVVAGVAWARRRRAARPAQSAHSARISTALKAHDARPGRSRTSTPSGAGQ